MQEHEPRKFEDLASTIDVTIHDTFE